MTSNKLWLPVILTLGMILTGCCDGPINNNIKNNGKTVTFALEKINSTTFCITIDGTDWSETATNTALNLLDLTDLKCKHYLWMNGDRISFSGTIPVLPKFFTVELIGKTIVAKIKSDSLTSGYTYANLQGTLSLTVGSINNYLNETNTDNPIYESTTYAIATGKGTITF